MKAYSLCHKNKCVMTVEFDPDAGRFGRILSIYNEKHIPVGLENMNGYNLTDALQYWWNSRLIPKNRAGFKSNNSDVERVINISNGFNLSDQYWIKPEDSEMKWGEGNFFTNDFNEEIGKYITGESGSVPQVMDSQSPDFFSNGQQDKRWVVKHGRRLLMKYGYPPYYEQPFNEMLASEICRRLGFPHVEYSFLTKSKPRLEIYSTCPCFVDDATEFVPAGFIQYGAVKEKGMSSYDHLLKCCKALGMDDYDGIRKGLAQMMLLDYITANIDRHYGNFGFIRNAETLEWKGLSPIFDNGNAMFYNFPTSDLRKSGSLNENVICKSFAKTQNDQLKKYASSVEALGIDFKKLEGIEKYYDDILSTNPKVDDERRELLVGILRHRIEDSQEVIYSHNDVTRKYLLMLSDVVDADSFMARAASLKKNIGKESPAAGRKIDNYLQSLMTKDAGELEMKLKRDANRARKKGMRRDGAPTYEK